MENADHVTHGEVLASQALRAPATHSRAPHQALSHPPTRVFCSQPAHVGLCSRSARKADTRQLQLFTAGLLHRDTAGTRFLVVLYISQNKSSPSRLSLAWIKTQAQDVK